MNMLFPEIKPFSQRLLPVSSLHTLSVAQYGSPCGIPVIVLHDGPGDTRCPNLIQLFNPNDYHIITYDQRGCGLSTPLGELRDNNAQALIDDIDVIRENIGIEQWLIYGGAWGAQLGLRYAFKYSHRVTGFILHSPFLGRRQDFHWRYFANGGAAHIFPDHYTQFCHRLNQVERLDPITAYGHHLQQHCEFEQLACAQQWWHWKHTLAHFSRVKSLQYRVGIGKKLLAQAKIENYFYRHLCFMPNNHIIDNIHKINNLTGILTHGRYDMVCPLEGSQALTNHWRNCRLHIVPSAGHDSDEIAMIDALVQSTNTMADWLRKRV